MTTGGLDGFENESEIKNENIDGIYSPDVLPDKFISYELLSCLKYAEESRVYLVKKVGVKYILKYGAGHFRDILSEEYERLKDSDFSFIPKAVDFFRTDTESWLLREYIEGRTLYNTAETFGPYSERDAITAALAVIDLVGEMHNHKPPVIHRDIKPQNIVVTADGQYKIIDMGSVRNWSKEKKNDTVYYGTLEVSAPEQFGYAQTDERTDIYGLGMLLLFLLTDSFSRDNIDNINVSSKIRLIIKKCLEFDPDKRYRNVVELKKALIKPHIFRNNFIKIIASITILTAVIISSLYLTNNFHSINIYQQQDNNTTQSADIKYLSETEIESETEPETEIETEAEVEPQPVIFTELLIEQAIRSALKMSETEPVYPNDLKRVTALCIIGNKILAPDEANKMHYIPDGAANQKQLRGTIKDISVLSMCVNLRFLTIDAEEIEDISPLSGLPLEHLSLQLNPIFDISPLVECKDIESLLLEWTSFRDLSAVSNMPYLNWLDITCCYNVRSVEPLRGLNITKFEASDITFRDYEYIATLPLKELKTSNLTEYQIDLLCTIDTLETVCIAFVTFKDLKQFVRLPKLNTLILYSEVEDFTAIFEMKSLEQIYVTPKQAEQIYAISATPPFKVRIIK